MSDASIQTPPAAPAHPRRWRAILASAELPGPLASLVNRTIRRAGRWFRLWPSERADLARELIAHFRDGLASGRSPAELANDFGDPPAAARLIARAKRRSRPAWSRTISHALRGFAAVALLCFVAYAYLGARFYLGRPNIAHNYLADLNKPVLATPEDERAWPIVIQSIRAFGPFPADFDMSAWPSGPSDPQWAQTVAYLHSHADAMALVRQAAAAPALGYVYRGICDPDYMKALEVRSPGYQYMPEPEADNPMLVGVLLPHLGEFRRLARMLNTDAADAAISGDRKRFIADIEASLGLARHTWSERILISQLVGVAVGELTCRTVREHAFTPGLLHDSDLTRLAHDLGSCGGDPIRFDFATERSFFLDFMQRFFTDDGHGDGVPVYENMPQVFRDFGVVDPSKKLLVRAALPVVAAAQSGRAAMGRQLDSTIAAYEHDQNLPLWRRAERHSDVERTRLMAMASETFPVFTSLSAGNPVGSQLITRDLFVIRREATLTALALESFHRRTGEYPTSLESLVPQFLPRMPIDGADGRALRYKLVDGRPLLYSIGVDGDDDGGRPPVKGNKHAFRFGPAVASPEYSAQETDPTVLADLDGDWILYPELPDAPITTH